MKKKGICAAAVAAVVLAAVGGFFFAAGKQTKLELTVDGVPVEEEEFLDAMNRKKYEVTRYFYDTYEANVDASFWETEFGGEIPYEMLADQTMQLVAEEKAAYLIAQEKGYIESASYQDLLKRLEEENQSRAEKIAKGEPVYGLSEFTLQTYREYELDMIQKRYCEDLSNEGMEISEEEREAYYEQNKAALFVKNDDITLEYIKISYEADEIPEEERADLKARMTAVYKKMDADHSLKELAEAEEKLKSYFMEETILSAEYSAKAKMIEDVISYSVSLSPGESTQVIEENGALYLVQCTARTEYDYQPIEEVKDNINKELREQHYNDIVAQRAAVAAVDREQEKVFLFTKQHINP